ncbi:hypothetical protein BC938DRAFT_478302 [Jimgerdemannia flammicorona]|uniref:Uncharacterized protein n=1 Tax=Jimgerdemannia flammicorona TaxID=994334 RepID=A0A433R0J3_9FUNG|nr:hypothetical protein BC938DRAFT_478302 [Jimgerdemannia flammicorona]
MQGSQKKYQTDWDAIAELDLLSNTQQKTSAQQQRNSTPALPAQNQLFYQQPSVFGNLPGSAGGPSTNPFVSPQPTSYGAAHFSSGLPSATNTSFNDSSSIFNTASSIQGFSGLGNACGPPLSATNGVFGVPSASLKKPDSWSSSLQNQPWASPQPQTGWGTTTQIGQSRNIMDDFGDFATPVVPVAVPVAVPKDDFGDFFSSTSTAATPSPSSVQPQSFAPVSSNDQFNAFSDLSSLSSSSFTSTAPRPQLQQQPSYNPNTDLAGKRMSWTSSVPSHTVANGSSWAPSSIPMASPTPDSKRTSLVYGMAPTGSSPTHTSPRMASVTPVFPLARTRSASVLSNESTSSFGSTGRQEITQSSCVRYSSAIGIAGTVDAICHVDDQRVQEIRQLGRLRRHFLRLLRTSISITAFHIYILTCRSTRASSAATIIQSSSGMVVTNTESTAKNYIPITAALRVPSIGLRASTGVILRPRADPGDRHPTTTSRPICHLRGATGVLGGIRSGGHRYLMGPCDTADGVGDERRDGTGGSTVGIGFWRHWGRAY